MSENHKKEGSTTSDLAKWILERTNWQIGALIMMGSAGAVILLVGFFGMQSVWRASELTGTFSKSVKELLDTSLETNQKLIRQREEALNILIQNQERSNRLERLKHDQIVVQMTLNHIDDLMAIFSGSTLSAERQEYYRAIESLAQEYPPTLPEYKWGGTMLAEYVKSGYMKFAYPESETDRIKALKEFQRRDAIFSSQWPDQVWRILFIRASAADNIWKHEKDLTLKSLARTNALDSYSRVISKSIVTTHRLVSYNNYAWLIHVDNEERTVNDLGKAWEMVQNANKLLQEQPQLIEILSRKFIAQTIYDTAEQVASDLAAADHQGKTNWLAQKELFARQKADFLK